MKKIDVKNVDWDNVFLHYTNSKNQESIAKNGLIAQIGPNSKIIEKNNQVFFSIGEKGALVIINSWIKWLACKPRTDWIYHFGCLLLGTKFFPGFIVGFVSGICTKINHYNDWYYKKMQNILDNSVYYVLDLEENVDFSYDDIDEVKANGYPAELLQPIFAHDSDILNPKQEYWNMHTFFGKNIPPAKLALLSYNGTTNANEIIKWLVEKNKDFVKTNCAELYRYYQFFYQDQK